MLPLCCRKPSIPARSVSTWKLIACKPFTTASFKAFAISHPIRTMTIASKSFGTNSPTWWRKVRSGSSAMFICSIALSLLQLLLQLSVRSDSHG